MPLGPIGGMSQKAWGLKETVFDTPQAFGTIDAIDFREMSFQPTLDFTKLQSHVGTSSLQGEVEEKRGGQWSAAFYVEPAAAGTPPDIGFLLAHALGQEVIVGGTSVTYNLLDTTPSGLQLAKYASDNLMEQINGAWIETLEIEIAGGEEPKITVNGGFASYGMLMQGATLVGNEAAAQTDIGLSPGHARLVRPGVFVAFGADNNGGAGYRVTAVNYATDTITVTPGLAVGASLGDPVTPAIPTQTLGGTVVGGISCGLSINAAAIGMIKSVTTLNTGIRGLDKEATSNRATRLFRDGRVVEGNLEVYYLDENAQYMGGAWNGNLAALTMRAGPNVAGSRMKINHLAARLAVVEGIEIPDEEAATATINYIARQSVVPADEMSIVFD